MNRFEIVKDNIVNRRSIKPGDMNGGIIEKEQILQLLELANYAPTHGRTEPWRFVVYEKEAKKTFCADHANLYKTHTDPEKFTTAKYDKLVSQGDTLSHIVVAYMKRSVGNSIPAIEEAAAVSAAIQNILLGAAALDIAVLWSTGGMTHHPSLKTYLGLGEEDLVMGLLLMGYTDQPALPVKRNSTIDSKVMWM
ncbi:MAG: nitroreductase [Bacteroidota bacterium]|nr:nitroreductase [Bacteroidota bacterium]